MLAAGACLAASAGATSAREHPAPALNCPLDPGRSSHEIRVDARVREVKIEVGPRAGKDGPAPVIFLWHGWGGDPRRLLNGLDLARVWPEAVVVAPRGLPRRFPGMGARIYPGWQIADGELADRDLQLFDALVRELSPLACLDAHRFVSSGFSNGGYFSNLLGCRRANVLAAIAPVSGAGPYEDSCDAPIPVWIAHGSHDRIVPLQQGRVSFETWQKRNGCEVSEPAPAGCSKGAACNRETVLCTFPGGHLWPRQLAKSWVRFLQGQRLPADEEP